jgi:heme/copper-type cytochrome/quinol oxidase subunit 2
MRVLAVVLGLLVGVQNFLMACPSCSDNFTKGSANASVGDSYSWSVLFMLFVPLTIVTVFTILVTKRLRNPQQAS